MRRSPFPDLGFKSSGYGEDATYDRRGLPRSDVLRVKGSIDWNYPWPSIGGVSFLTAGGSTIRKEDLLAPSGTINKKLP